MKNRTSRIFAAGLVIAAGTLAGALARQEPPAEAAGAARAVVQADANAAPRYWQGLYPIDARLQKTPDLNLSAVDAKGKVDWAAVDALRSVVGESREALAAIVSASRMQHCDFVSVAIRDQGPNTLLPHVAAFRRASQLLIADALMNSRAGRSDAAAESFAAVIRMAGHIQGDRILLSSLVSAGMIRLVEPPLQDCAQRGGLTPDNKAAIIAALSALDDRDPLAIQAAIAGERESFVGWLRRAEAPKVIEFFSSFPQGSDANAARIIREALERGDSIEPYIKLAEAYYDMALKAWNTDRAAQRLSDLSSQAASGKYGPLAQLLGPSWANICEAEARGVASIKNIRSILGQ